MSPGRLGAPSGCGLWALDEAHTSPLMSLPAVHCHGAVRVGHRVTDRRRAGTSH